ncbi:MAG TPA: mechanosensitive ion channel domain-containing protein, partial [Acidimicrobiia bacterium]
MDQLAENLNIDPETLSNLVRTLAAIAVVLILRRVARRIVVSNVEDTETSYRANKIINYTATGILLVTVAFIWVDAFDNLPTYLGLVSAGVAIALADVLKNMVGWLYILSRRPFQVSDRIEVNGFKGDVVDIRLFRFSLMEIDGWVDAEQSTGRLVHVPNGVVFNREVANYTEGFGFIWHEVPV